MELRKGFKLTKVGMIPEDWSQKSIGAISTVIRGASPRPKGDKRYYGGTIPRLMVEDVSRDGKYVTPTVDFLTEEGAKRSRPCKAGTLTIVCSGTVGVPSFLKVDACIHDGFLGIINIAKDVSDEYLYYQFVRMREQFDKSATHGGIFTNLTTSAIKEFLLPVPIKKAEQTAIATALSDMDALIIQTEKLIEKKKAIKQGMMQQLLSPYDKDGKMKKGWEEKTLFEIADGKKELFNDGDWIESEHITTSGVRLVQTGNIGVGKFVEKEEKKYIFESSFKKLRCKALNKGDILVCRLAEPAGRACLLPDIDDEKIVTSVDVTIFRPRKEVANRIFLINLFSTSQWFSKIAERVGGTTHKRISRNSLGKVRIIIPSIEVQNKIAESLNVIDKEIIQLEIKSGKLQSLKQSMMQTLLTGKIRIYKPEHEPATPI